MGTGSLGLSPPVESFQGQRPSVGLSEVKAAEVRYLHTCIQKFITRNIVKHVAQIIIYKL